MLAVRGGSRIGVLVALALGAAGCSVGQPSASGPQSFSSGDREVYASVAALAGASDVVIEGTIGRDLATEDVAVGQDDTYQVAFHAVDVTRVLAGPEVGASLVYADFPPNLECGEQVTSGEHVVLFLAHQSRDDVPGIDGQTDWYIAVGCDDGMLDVADGNATARSPNLVSLESPAAPPEGEAPPLHASVDDIAAAAETHLG